MLDLTKENFEAEVLKAEGKVMCTSIPRSTVTR